MKRRLSAQHKRKIAASMRRYVKTAEHCANISRAKKGHTPSAATCRKIARKARGRRHTNATRAKMSATHIARNARVRAAAAPLVSTFRAN